MEKINISKGWLFHIEDEDYIKTGDASLKDIRSTYGFNKAGAALGFPARKFDNTNWRKVDLPHDYAIELDVDQKCSSICGTRPLTDSVALYESDILRADTKVFPVAWYRKNFFVSENGEVDFREDKIYLDRKDGKGFDAPENKRYFIEFEGVFRDYVLWINGSYIDRHNSGYTGRVFDITDQLIFGETNTIAVRVDCTQHEGWFYEGGGIYRDVNIYVSEDVFCKEEDLYIIPETNGNVEIRADVYNMGEEPVTKTISFKINGKEYINENVVLDLDENNLKFNTFIENPLLWDIDSPNMYTLEMLIDGKTEQTVKFGFKDVLFDTDKGFFLNGRNLKINGVCLHQDFFGVGVAVDEDIVRYKLMEMQKMGANAMRCVHNPVSKVTLDLCDELGIMVMNETRMFGSSPEALRQLESVAKRDRNHPSIILWSLGNEEFEQNTKLGKRMCKTACKLLKKLVPNGIQTFGANHGEIYEGVNELFDIRGMNYIRIDVTKPGISIPDFYHKEHPEQAIYCSEEISSLTVRGIYETDAHNGYVDAYGESTMNWGSTPEGYVKYAMARDYFCGGFMWTGFDYHGEPSPFAMYKSNGKKNISSTFGIVDLCGFPKDSYYYYKAWWTNEPVLHILPHWNFKDGKQVRVVAHTNCEKVTLYLNDRKIDEVTPEKYSSPEWNVPFEAGVLKAVGIKDGKEYISVRKTSKPTGIDIKTTKVGKYVFADVISLDEDGNVYPLACDNIELVIKNGEIIATGNGDPTYDGRVNWFSEVLTKEIELAPKEELQGEVLEYNDHRRFGFSDYYEEKQENWEDKFRIIWKSAPEKEKLTYNFSGEFLADESFEFVELSGVNAAFEVYLNGELVGNADKGEVRPYRFYNKFKNGKNEINVKLSIQHDIKPEIKSVIIGKSVKPSVKHPLFNGMMRVIVKPSDNCVFTAKSDNGFSAETEI